MGQNESLPHLPHHQCPAVSHIPQGGNSHPWEAILGKKQGQLSLQCWETETLLHPYPQKAWPRQSHPGHINLVGMEGLGCSPCRASDWKMTKGSPDDRMLHLEETRVWMPLWMKAYPGYLGHQVPGHLSGPGLALCPLTAAALLPPFLGSLWSSPWTAAPSQRYTEFFMGPLLWLTTATFRSHEFPWVQQQRGAAGCP